MNHREERSELPQTLDEAQQRIRELEDRVAVLQALIEQAPALVFAKDLQGRYTVVSQQLAEQAGVKAEALIGKSEQAFLSKGVADTLIEAERRVMEDGEILEKYEVVERGADAYTYFATKFPLYDADGEIFGLGAIITDVTARIQAEAERDQLTEQLRDEQQMLRTVLEHMPAGVFVVAAPDGRSMLVNEISKVLLGPGIDPQASPDERVDVYPVYVYGTEQVYPEERLPLSRALRGETSSVEDIEVRRPDHTNALLRVSASPIHNAQGEITAAIAMLEDITAFRQAELERERLQQEVIEAQREALKELSTPVIPVMERILVMPLVGSIDTMRARDIMRALLGGISEHRAKVVILDVTGVPVMDTGIVSHINKTIQAARLKGAQTIVTGISDAVAEAIVDLGIDWGAVETLSDLRTGLTVALNRMGVQLVTD